LELRISGGGTGYINFCHIVKNNPRINDGRDSEEIAFLGRGDLPNGFSDFVEKSMRVLGRGVGES
jgi:hypothetical protein